MTFRPTDDPCGVLARLLRRGVEAGWNGHVRRAVAAGAAAGIALLISTRAPLLGPLLVALTLGVGVANLPVLGRWAAEGSKRTDKFLLRSGVVLLGLKVSLTDVVQLGAPGLLVVLATVVVTFGATQTFGRVLGLDRELTTLIAAGFSICGAAAIAAVESSIRAKPKDVALAVALVTVFGTMMIGLVPIVGAGIGLSDQQTAVWAGASIHEVAQVVAAASLVSGATALSVATTVKLARVLLLAPVQLMSARVCSDVGGAGRTGPLVPGFLLGFLAAVCLRSTGLVPDGALEVAFDVTTLLLSAAMFGLGTNIVARNLWPVPVRALLLSTISTGVAAIVSLALIVAFV